MPHKRNYKKEYKQYHETPLQKKKRASRNKARRSFEKAGLVSKGDNFKASLSQRIERGMSVAITREIGRLERGMTFLASIG